MPPSFQALELVDVGMEDPYVGDPTLTERSWTPLRPKNPCTSPIAPASDDAANKDVNRLLRQYFPKGTNLAVHSPRHVNTVMNEPINRSGRATTTTPQPNVSTPPSAELPPSSFPESGE